MRGETHAKVIIETESDQAPFPINNLQIMGKRKNIK